MRNLKKERKQKEAKGITLIALVITIIVLLILAAVSIATLAGENGILTKAENAKVRDLEGEEKEQIGLAYNAAKTNKYEQEDYTGKITAENLEEELKKEETNIKVKTNGEDLIVTFPNGHEYTVKNDGKIDGPKTGIPVTEEKLAKEVLTIDPNAEEDYKKSPYVKYNEILCRVFYNDEYDDEKHGLQIITAKSVNYVTLGSGDNSVSEDDFSYDTTVEGAMKTLPNDFRKAAASYNKVVETLNNKARDYMLEIDKTEGTDENKIVIDARSLGSIAKLKGGKFQLEDDAPMYPSEEDVPPDYINKYKFDGKLKNTDDNYIEDVGNNTEEKPGQLKKLGLSKISSTWLASHYVSTDSNSTYFKVRLMSSDGYLSDNDLCEVRSNGSMSSSSVSYGFRPVFLLSSDVKIKSGDGTSNNPYELGI